MNRIKKQYIIRKYVMAKDVRDALRQDKMIKADEAWIDPEWQKQYPEIGYNVTKKDRKCL